MPTVNDSLTILPLPSDHCLIPPRARACADICTHTSHKTACSFCLAKVDHVFVVGY